MAVVYTDSAIYIYIVLWAASSYDCGMLQVTHVFYSMPLTYTHVVNFSCSVKSYFAAFMILLGMLKLFHGIQIKKGKPELVVKRVLKINNNYSFKSKHQR